MATSQGSPPALERPGQAACLLHGFMSLPLGAGTLGDVADTPLRLLPCEPTASARPGFQPLRVSVHRDLGSLIDALCPYQVQRSMFDGPEFNVRPSRLLSMSAAEQLRDFETRLGVQFTPGSSYVLLDLWRNDGRLDHEVTAQPSRRFFDRMWHLLPEFRRASVRLAAGERIHDGRHHDVVISACKAQRYVELFYRYGTHFVSGIELGARLVQVLVLEPDRSDLIFEQWLRLGDGQPLTEAKAALLLPILSAPHVLSTGPIINLASGHALDAASMRALSNDAARPGLVACVQRPPDWPLHASAVRESGAVRVELTSLARFMEYFRALNFERILRGALMQRWERQVELPIRRTPTMTRSAASADAARAITSSSTCRSALTLSGGSLALDANATWLVQSLAAAPTSQHAPELVLTAAAFERGSVVCQTMAGALVLRHGDKRDAVIDGLRFTSDIPDPNSGLTQVRVRGDLHHIDAESLKAALSLLTPALNDACATLACFSPHQPAYLQGASHARWLVGLAALGDQSDAALQTRALGLYLERVWPTVCLARPRRSTASDARMRPLLENLSSIAIDADEVLHDLERTAPDHEGARPSELFDASAFAKQRFARFQLLRRAALADYERLLQAIAPDIEKQHASALCELRAAQHELAASLNEFAESERCGSIAARTVLVALAHATSDAPLPAAPDELLQGHAEPSFSAALTFLSQETAHRDEQHHLHALERLCEELLVAQRTLADDVLSLQRFPAWQRSELEPADERCLRAALCSDGASDPTADTNLTRLLNAWTRLTSARAELAGARRARCRVELEPWLFELLSALAEHAEADAMTAPTAPRVGAAVRCCLLTVLGYALSLQRADNRDGKDLLMNPDEIRPGVLGYLLRQELVSRSHARAPNVPSDQAGAAT